MNWQEAEQLVERIRAEAPKPIAVLGIEPFGPGAKLPYAPEYYVKCECQITGLRFVVKSLEHWEDLKQHVIVRICKVVYGFVKGKKSSIDDAFTSDQTTLL